MNKQTSRCTNKQTNEQANKWTNSVFSMNKWAFNKDIVYLPGTNTLAYYIKGVEKSLQNC
jgi:hypothetical protein